MADLVFQNKLTGDSFSFANKVRNISDILGLPANDVGANWLMAVMNSESGLNPAAQNNIGATGLIQFLPSTAKELGTSIDELKNMSALDQLDYVSKYFKPFTNKLKTLPDTYLAIFYPAAIGKGLNYVFPEWVYLANPGLGKNVSDFEKWVWTRVPAELRNKNNFIITSILILLGFLIFNKYGK